MKAARSRGDTVTPSDARTSAIAGQLPRCMESGSEALTASRSGRAERSRQKLRRPRHGEPRDELAGASARHFITRIGRKIGDFFY
jgi:hypothetical protein